MREFHIGSVTLQGYATLAPMAGVADAAFRSICREYGAAMTTSEMVSAKALCYSRHDEKTRSLMRPWENEAPFAVQLFGSEPEILAQGAAIVSEQVHPDVIDLNMGCPVPKVAQNGEGSALMRTPERMAEIVRAVRKAVKLPVTVKMRLGWDEEHINAVECAIGLEEAGVSAITVHGRTRNQFYAGKADYEAIRQVAETVRVPVIANGDVFTAEDAKHLYEVTGVKMVAVGRGALGNPWIFREINAFFENERFTSPTVCDKMDLLMKQTRRAVSRKGEHTAIREARAQTMQYVKGLRGAAQLKNMASKLCTYRELEAFCKEVSERE